jgi:hypothetical protein
MPFLRKIVFYAFVVIYLIICPVLILRLLGFVFDPIAKHWVKTGIIYISSNPPEANVYINDRLAPEKTPTIIRDLTPGNYTVRMELAGHEPWENNLPVVDKKATSIENILLIPKKWDTKTIHPLKISSIIGMPGSNTLLAMNDDSVNSILVLHLNDMEETDYLFPAESIYSEGKLVNYYTVTQSAFIVMQISLGEKHKYLWVDPRDKLAHIEDISDLINSPPQRLYWEPNDDKNLYAFYDGFVSRINIKAKAIYPNIDPKLMPTEKKKAPIKNAPQADQAFVINNGNTFLLRKGNEIFLMDNLDPTQARLTKILTIRHNTDIIYYEKTGKIYFISEDTSKLTSMTVLHHKPFIPKPIAETLRLNPLEES